MFIITPFVNVKPDLMMLLLTFSPALFLSRDNELDSDLMGIPQESCDPQVSRKNVSLQCVFVCA